MYVEGYTIVFDYREAVKKFSKDEIRVEEGGSYRFDGVERFFGRIEVFCGHNANSRKKRIS